ncbi:MAG: hypothetical protein R2851_16660 [Caldilineaceae bacterium]
MGRQHHGGEHDQEDDITPTSAGEKENATSVIEKTLLRCSET